MNDTNSPNTPDDPKSGLRSDWRYYALVAAAALAWLAYSFSGQRSPLWMTVSGVAVLILLIPMLRR